MPDPFEALRTALTPIDPDPAFAARLRARVARALQPEQGDRSMISQSPETADQVRQGDISYLALWVPDMDRAARFYADVLGWQFPAQQEPWARTVEGQSIALGLSQLSGTVQYLRSTGIPLSKTMAPTVYVVFIVDDVDAAAERVRAAGGFCDVRDQPHGRIGACVDDQGLAFSIQQKVPMPRPPINGARHGDPAYLTFRVPDSARARAFFESVMEYRFAPGRTPGGWELHDVAPMTGMMGGAAQSTIVPMWRVDDIRAAVERVRAAGGTASDPSTESYGLSAVCADDQGLEFYLGQL